MQKSALQYGEIIFQSKVIPRFLSKCSKLVRKCILYNMVYLIWKRLKKRKKRKTWQNEVDTKTVKNSNFRNIFLNIEKEFHFIL